MHNIHIYIYIHIYLSQSLTIRRFLVIQHIHPSSIRYVKPGGVARGWVRRKWRRVSRGGTPPRFSGSSVGGSVGGIVKVMAGGVRVRVREMSMSGRGHIEVRQLYMACSGDKDVIWLDVAMHNAMVVHVFHGRADLCDQKPCSRFRKAPIGLKS